MVLTGHSVTESRVWLLITRGQVGGKFVSFGILATREWGAGRVDPFQRPSPPTDNQWANLLQAEAGGYMQKLYFIYNQFAFCRIL